MGLGASGEGAPSWFLKMFDLEAWGDYVLYFKDCKMKMMCLSLRSL